MTHLPVAMKRRWVVSSNQHQERPLITPRAANRGRRNPTVAGQRKLADVRREKSSEHKISPGFDKRLS